MPPPEHKHASALADSAAAMRERVQSRLFGGLAHPPEILAGMTLRGRIASGAAGDVYLAHDPKLDRLVALKVLRAIGRDDGELRRLHREARTLARLAHPNVVHVYEVGDYAGQMYISMEYVPGSSMLDWQRGAGRTAHEILQRYLEAARGIAAAHTVGIIHRDVKPANILAGDDGRVCVADFGLAHPFADTEPDAVSPDGERSDVVLASPDDIALRTQSRHARGGTPAYMAPETIRDGIAEPRSDQFSWAVALYEALYERRPFTPGELVGATAPPGFVVPRRRPSGDRVPAWLPALLRRCLAWQRERRFATMDELLAAVRRTSRRHAQRFLVMLGASIAVTTSAATWYLSVDAPRCPDAGVELDGVWDDSTRAKSQGAFASTTLSFQATAWEYAARTLDEYAKAWLAVRDEACDATRVRASRSDELFDLTIACLDNRRRALAAVSSRVQVADAATVTNITQVLETLPELAPCLDSDLLRSDATFADGRADDGERARVEQMIADATATAAGGDHGAAETLVEQAVTDASDLGDLGLSADALFARARVHRSAGRVAETLNDLSSAVDAAEAASHDELKPQLLIALARASAELAEDGERAAEYVLRARASLLRVHREPEETPAWLEADAQARLVVGETDTAARALQNALTLRRAEPGARPTDIASTLVLLGNASLDAGRLEHAEVAYREAQEIRVTALGVGHPMVAEVDYSLGRLAHLRGDLDTAARSLTSARDVLASTYGESAPKLATVHLALGELATEQGDYANAIVEATAALEIQARVERPEASVVAGAHSILANAHRARGDDALALVENRRILALQSGSVPELELVPVLINIGHYSCRNALSEEEARRACADARPVFERALTALSDARDEDLVRLVPYVRKGLAKVELAAGNPNRALDHLQSAKAEQVRLDLHDEQLTGELELSFARAHLALGDRTRASERAAAARLAFPVSTAEGRAGLDELAAFVELLEGRR